MQTPRSTSWPVLPQLRRRWLLGALLTGGLLGWLARVDAVHAAPPRRSVGRVATQPPAALLALVDHLLPADALTPAASTLKVPHAMWREAQADPQLAVFIAEGCRWLDRYGDGFASLTEAEREVVCQWMSTAGWDTAQRRFFHWARDRAVTLYYSQPAALRGMPFDRPPQPLGFPAV